MFESLFIVLVILLLLLAAVDLFVGVSNDAVNFLNSAVGTRIAPLFVVMSVASLGVILGATFSSGMMEVARSGMFHPENFSYEEIMMIFAAVMISDVLLLNLFNLYGLPTSTTVSIIFELLGAAVFAAVYKIYGTGAGWSEVLDFIKLDRTATIVSAILLSVVIAFVSGLIVQFICRLLFTFRFRHSSKILGGVYCGLSLSAIFYFLVIKGAKGASFMNPERLAFLEDHFTAIMWSVFIAFTVIGQVMVLMNKNVFRLIILSGTFALAFSFAGNDLVNFIGVPLAALDSFKAWSASGMHATDFFMHALNENIKTETFWLFLAGLIMCFTLWTSKKAHRVVQTSINLSSSVSGSREQFGASPLGRIITRMGLGVSRTVYFSMPASVIGFVRRRYVKAPIVKGQLPLPFDYVRASVNLVLASALISLATSFKLPLSTTYVCFMVAMGTSFADGAWDRESAVYRISGVITVVAGWFLTAISAFISGFIINFVIFNCGSIAVFSLILLVFAIIIYTNFIKKSKSEQSGAILKSQTDKEILDSVGAAVPDIFSKDLDCLKQAVTAFFEDNEFALRKSRNKASNLQESISADRSGYYSLALDLDGTFEMLPPKSSKRGSSTVDAKFFFYLVYSNMLEAAKSVHYALDQAVIHVANRHTIFGGAMRDSLFELLKRLDRIEQLLRHIVDAPDATNVESVVRQSKKLNRDIDKCQLELVSIIGKQRVSMHSSEMYLTFLQCMRDITNRYVAVCMQERALAELVAGNCVMTSSVDGVAQSGMLDTAFRSDRDDLVNGLKQVDKTQSAGIIANEDAEPFVLPKSPAAMEAESASAKKEKNDKV